MEFVKERNVTALKEATVRAVRTPFRALAEVRTVRLASMRRSNHTQAYQLCND